MSSLRILQARCGRRVIEETIEGVRPRSTVSCIWPPMRTARKFGALTEGILEQSIATQVKAFLNLVTIALPYLEKSPKARIVTTSSFLTDVFRSWRMKDSRNCGVEIRSRRSLTNRSRPRRCQKYHRELRVARLYPEGRRTAHHDE